MITPTDIQMCVADCLQDDTIESFDLILDRLNNSDQDSDSWSLTRGAVFTECEVREALRHLIHHQMVTPCAESLQSDECTPIEADQVDVEYPIESLWFHLEQSGRNAIQEWWESVGKIKFPLQQAE